MFTELNLPAVLYCLKKALDHCVPFGISPRTIRGRQYYYRQWTENGKRQQKYIKKENEAQDLERYHHKQKIKAAYHEAQQAFNALTPAAKCLITQKIHFLEALEQIPTKLHKNQYIDGTLRDSKNELIINLMMDHFKIENEYGSIVFTRNDSFMVTDISFPNLKRKVKWEHLGMLELKEYFIHNRNKVHNYIDIGYTVSKNLILTRDHVYTDENGKVRHYIRLPEIAWNMVKYDLVKPNKMRHFMKI